MKISTAVCSDEGGRNSKCGRRSFGRLTYQGGTSPRFDAERKARRSESTTSLGTTDEAHGNCPVFVLLDQVTDRIAPQHFLVKYSTCFEMMRAVALMVAKGEQAVTPLRASPAV